MEDNLKIETSNSSTSNGLFTCPINTTLSAGNYCLESFTYPVSFYNITSSANTIVYNASTGTYTASITPGYYNSTTILSALKSALESAISNVLTFTVTISASTSKITISATGNFAIISGTAAPLLGFPSSTLPLASVSSLLATNAINLGRTSNLNVQIVGCNSILDVTASVRKRYSFLVPLSYNSIYGNIVTYSPEKPTYVKILSDITSQIVISIYDDNGNLISFNGLPISFILKKLT